MKRILIFVSMLSALFFTASVFAGYLQNIQVVNMLWNENATNGTPGMTPTAVVLSFNNGGAKPCFTTTLAYQADVTVHSGAGQGCVNAITSMNIVPVAVASGTTYTTPPDVLIPGGNYSTQILISNKTDPVFDSSNGAIKVQGTVLATVQGHFASTEK